MSEILLTAAMIVRDEARHLPDCLASLQPLVDEIVIVDTGSRDESVAIAESFGARVDHLPWADDFSAPRNRSLDLARGTWILYIDADERLEPVADIERTRERLATAVEPALRVRFRSRVGNTPYWEYRLWRSDPRIRFERQMHETVVEAIAGVAIADGQAVGDCELALQHVGYEGNVDHKHRRNLPIIRSQLAHSPDDPYIQTHLGETLLGIGEEEAAGAAFERAVQAARVTGAPTGPCAFSALVQHRRRHGREADELLAEGLTLYPDSLWLAWHKVQVEIAAGNYADALTWLERFEVDVDMPVEDVVGHAVERFTVEAQDARGLCHFRLGQYAAAAAAYRTAEANAPQEPRLRIMRQLCEHHAQRDCRESSIPGAARAVGWHRRALLHGAVVDLAGVPVRLEATDAARARAMHALFARMALTARAAEAELRFDGHRQPVPIVPADEVQGDLQTWHRTDTIFVEQQRGLSGRSWERRARIGGYAGDLTVAFGNAAPPLLAALLSPFGRFVLHAGALERDGSTILLLGGSGAGKSTLVYGAIEAGWRVLSDDLVLLRAGANGALVTGLPRPLAVPRDVFDPAAERLPARNDYRARIYVPFEGWDPGEYPVRASILVDHGPHDIAALEPVERPEVLGNLLRAMLDRRRASIRRYFPLAGQICAAPAHRLRHCRVPIARPREAARTLERL